MPDDTVESNGSLALSQRRGVRRALIGAVVAAAATVLAFSLIADLSDIGDAIRQFNWRYVPAILALTIWNYVWRSVKFRRYLASLDVPSAGVRRDFLIFLSGFALTITPGKVGELIRTAHSTPDRRPSQSDLGG
ncbi:MAG: lysylphosphatidylglycerol synthase domain-containing protein [Thermomicrobiales bacterium]